MRTSTAILSARKQQNDPADQARVASIVQSGMLDRGGEELDAITARVREVMCTEVAALNVIMSVEQRMLSASGISPITIPREMSFCTHIVANARPLMVNDAVRDPFFAGHPLVAVEGSVRSYCGVPITTEDGMVAGALCAIDSRERPFTPGQLLALTDLAQQARAILLPDAAPTPMMLPALWFREDPLVQWLHDHLPTETQLQQLAARRGILRWLHRKDAA